MWFSQGLRPVNLDNITDSNTFIQSRVHTISKLNFQYYKQGIYIFDLNMEKLSLWW
jgi:hypothetical protein